MALNFIVNLRIFTNILIRQWLDRSPDSCRSEVFRGRYSAHFES